MTREQAIATIERWLEGEECDRCMTFTALRLAINTVAGEPILEVNP